MTESNPPTRAIVLVFARPSAFGREAEWSEWYDDVHLPATVAGSGANVATRWEVADRPQGSSPPVGFTHVAIYEFDEHSTGPATLLGLLDGPRHEGGPIHHVHTVTDVDVLTPAGGRWTRLEESSARLTGRIIAYVTTNDPARIDEWNAWVDDVHVPDMMDSGAFSDATRWVRASPRPFGPNHLTMYDVSGPTVAEAVRLSGAAMAPAHAAGRMLDVHAGGLRAALLPTGRFGAAGFRRDG